MGSDTSKLDRLHMLKEEFSNLYGCTPFELGFEDEEAGRAAIESRLLELQSEIDELEGVYDDAEL